MATSLTTVQVRAASRTPTRRNPLARYTPKSLSADSRWRFIRDRRARYLADIPGGVASDAQAARIERMIKLEWAALVSGRSAPPTGRATEAYADVGRRGGKTRIMSLVAAWLAVFEDWQQFLDPG